jgi:hypothetical protein
MFVVIYHWLPIIVVVKILMHQFLHKRVLDTVKPIKTVKMSISQSGVNP